MAMKGFKLLLAGVCLLLASAATAQSHRRSAIVLDIEGTSYYIHKLVKGDTFFHLSQLYGVSIDEIRSLNPSTAEGLKADQTIRIPYTPEVGRKKMSARKQSRLFDEHTVNRGETGYSIARRYSIGFSTLLEDNPGVDFTHLEVGRKLLIRKSGMGTSDDVAIRDELDDYRDALNSVTPGYDYHVVERGETLYSLGKRFGVSVEELRKINNLSDDAIQAGGMLMVPAEGKTPGTESASTPDPQREATPGDARIPDYKLFPGARDRARLRRQSDGTADVALLLPFTSGGKPNRSMAEFYNGCKLAIEELREAGMEMNIDVYDTKRSAEEVARIIGEPDFARTDLIIGPVYAEAAAPAVEYAAERGIALVSPLAAFTGEGTPEVYQMAPDESCKYEKLREWARGGAEKNVVFVYGAKNDAELEREMKSLFAGTPYREYRYAKGVTTADNMASLITNGENLFVVLSTDEISSEQILAAISSAHNNLTARSLRHADISVAASSQWTRFSKLDKNLFFKLKVTYVTSYHADRTDRAVLEFDNRYIKAFGSVPSLYSYRGYDAVKMFAGSMESPGDNFAERFSGASPQLLQMPYRFVQRNPGGTYINSEWALVRYLDNYTIEVR